MKFLLLIGCLFVLSPTGEKDGPFFGPYTVKGSPDIPAAQMDLIKAHKGRLQRIFIEGVKVNSGGKEMTTNPVILMVKN